MQCIHKSSVKNSIKISLMMVRKIAYISQTFFLQNFTTSQYQIKILTKHTKDYDMEGKLMLY